MRVKQLEVTLHHSLTVEQTEEGRIVTIFPREGLLNFGKLPIRIAAIPRTSTFCGTISQFGLDRQDPVAGRWTMSAWKTRINGEIIVTMYDYIPSYMLIVESMDVWRDWDLANGIKKGWQSIAIRSPIHQSED